MTLGKELVKHRLFHEPVGLAFDTLTALVPNDVALVLQLVRVQRIEQKPHAVALQPEGELELVRGKGFEVVRAVEVGRSVDVARARGLEELKVRVFVHMLGTLKHHVLEKMGETGPSGSLVGGADMIPEVDRDQG